MFIKQENYELCHSPDEGLSVRILFTQTYVISHISIGMKHFWPPNMGGHIVGQAVYLLVSQLAFILPNYHLIFNSQFSFNAMFLTGQNRFQGSKALSAGKFGTILETHNWRKGPVRYSDEKGGLGTFYLSEKCGANLAGLLAGWFLVRGVNDDALGVESGTDSEPDALTALSVFQTRH